MSQIRVTLRVEITENEWRDGAVSAVYERTLSESKPDNPRFFASYAQKVAVAAQADVLSAIEAVHGKAPE